ncbi:MAG: hypothetical protein Q8M29_01700 [Bacteroidota bacterium]|nr:hypothetical protein [Bacteroidota bacterium]
MIKKYSLILLSVLIGGLFLFSAYSKLYPIEPFEFTFVDIGISNWRLSPFFARTIIGLEFFIGILFIINYKTRGFTSKLSIGILTFFVLYLCFILIKNGNDSNCGCFGELIKMTPVESIIKNLALILVNIVLLKWGEEINLKKFRIPVISLLLVISIAIPYILNPVDLNYSKAYLMKKENQYFMPLDTLVNNAYIHPVSNEIKKSKHIVAYLSSSCPHCKIAATKLRIMKDKNKNLPLLFVINGEEEKVKVFLDETKSHNVAWTKLGERPFVYLAGTHLPSIVLVNNQTVEYDLNYFFLDQTEIENWLKK